MSPEEYSREDIEALNEVRPYCFESDREEQWFKVGLQYGLDAADAEWISIDDDLPYKHENLLVGNETVLVVVADIFGNVDTDFMTYANGAWGWWSNSNAAYWLPLPEFTND